MVCDKKMKASEIRSSLKLLLLFSILALFFASGCKSDKKKGFSIESFEAEVQKCSRSVNLSWTFQNGSKISGIEVYRTAQGASESVMVTGSPLKPDAVSWTDNPPSGSTTYSYHISCLVAGGAPVRSEKKTVTPMDGPQKVENLSLDWSNGKPRLFWASAGNGRFAIFRSMDSGAFQKIKETDSRELTDILPESFMSIRYRVIAFASVNDPQTGESYECEGAPSDFDVVARPCSSLAVNGAMEGRPGRFLVKTGSVPPFTLEGTCQDLGEVFTVRAMDKAGRTIPGTPRYGGVFNVSLDAAGTWEVIACSKDGKKICRFFVTLAEDGDAPVLTIPGEGGVIEASSGIFTVTGSVSDAEFPMPGLRITSDRFPGTNFACAPDASGHFSCQISLFHGMNIITVVATDLLGNRIEKTIKVNWPSLDLPVIIIESPADGSSVYSEKIKVSGTVRSSIAKDQMEFTVAGVPVQLQDGEGAYAFSAEEISLAEGPNVIVARASTQNGDSYARCHVTRFLTPPEDQEAVPVITVTEPSDGAFVSRPFADVKGRVKCPGGISTVTVNGVSASLAGSPFEMSFSARADLSSVTAETHAIRVVARSSFGKTSEVVLNVKPDFLAPVITLDQSELLSYPVENRVRQNPYTISGYIDEKNHSSLTINQIPLNVTKDSSVPGRWRFTHNVDLVRDRNTRVDIVAKDFAGHTTTKSYILKLDTSFGYVIEIISPQPGAVVKAATDPFILSIAVRISGLSPDHEVSVLLDGIPVPGPAMSGEMFSGSFSLSGKDADHIMTVRVKDKDGSILAEKTSSFKVTAGADSSMVKVIRQEPADNATGVEPNAFVSFYFDKAIDQSKLLVILKETVHGQVYDEGSGGDISAMSAVNLKDVNRDQENVPGGMSFFPEKIMAAFYPSRYFGYGASVYVTVSYSGQEIYKSSFTVRSLPTLVQGMITDQFSRPIEGIEITLPDHGRKSVTDANGAYGFGFGDDEAKALPSGRFKIIANPLMKDVRYGVCEQFVTVTGGRLNQAASLRLPVINTAEPHRFIKSGDNPAAFLGGDLSLDLSGAGLLFPDGRSEGNVHADMLDISAVNYTSVTLMPNWMYAIQPMGINVSGSVGVTIKAPSAYGSHDYLAGVGGLALMMGYDPGLGRLVPVGAGIVDKTAKTVTSAGNLPLKRLDYIGYVLADAKLQALLEKFMNNEISLDGLVAGLGK